MNIDLTFDEAEEVIVALRFSAHESNRSANTAKSEGYSSKVASEMASRASDLYLLADKIAEQRQRFGVKPSGSSGTIDPFNTPLKRDSAKTPNDPVEW
jgi:hypothetical protein